MGEVWLGVDDPWPDHPHQEWRITLEQARRAGWLLRKVSAHGYGLIVCKRSSGDAGRDFCQIKVESTARATENVARSARTKLSRCRHRDDAPPDPASDAAVLLASAERLLDAAERCHEGRRLAARAEELLDGAEADLEAAFALAESMDAEGEQLVSAAASTAAAEGADLGRPPDPRPALTLAERHVDAARQMVRGEPSARARRVKAQVEVLRERGSALRLRLS